MWAESNKKVLDFGFLYASPLIYKDVRDWRILPQLDFVSEAKHIKEAIYGSNKAIKIKGKVGTLENFIEFLQD